MPPPPRRMCVRRVRGGFWQPGNWPLQDFQCPVCLDAGVPEMFQQSPFRVAGIVRQMLQEAAADLGPYRFRIGKDIQDDVQDLLAELRIPQLDARRRLWGGGLPLLWSDVLVKIAGVDAHSGLLRLVEVTILVPLEFHDEGQT